MYPAKRAILFSSLLALGSSAWGQDPSSESAIQFTGQAITRETSRDYDSKGHPLCNVIHSTQDYRESDGKIVEKWKPFFIERKVSDCSADRTEAGDQMVHLRSFSPHTLRISSQKLDADQRACFVQAQRDLLAAYTANVNEGLKATGISEISIRFLDNREGLLSASQVPLGFDSKSEPGKLLLHVTLTSDPKHPCKETDALGLEHAFAKLNLPPGRLDRQITAILKMMNPDENGNAPAVVAAPPDKITPEAEGMNLLEAPQVNASAAVAKTAEIPKD